MRISFENQGTNTYLVYEIAAEDELDSMSLGMLTNNKIPGIAEASFLQVDTTKYIKFNVSAKVSVSQLFSGPVSKKRLIGVFTGIIDAMLAAEDYMLDPNSMLLDLDYIFADVTTCEAVLICVPVMHMEHQNPDLSLFFKNIMFNTQFDQSDNCDHVAQIINYLNTNSVLSLNDFKALLDGIAKPKAEKKIQTPVYNITQNKPQPVVPVTPVQAVQSVQPVQPVIGEQEKVPAPEPPVINKTTSADPVQEEKPISMFYLLQHYNKENAAKYKAQKAAKKEKKGDEKKKESAGKAKQERSSSQANVGFAVPGQKNVQSNTDFAVPGQSPAHKEPQTVQPVVSSASQPTVKKTQPTVPQQPVQPVVQRPAEAISFGETTVLGSPMGETTVLGGAAASAVPKPYLIRGRNNEKIPINKPVFRIGKERSYVDYFVADNTAISRSHANIVSHNGEYFVVDTNSTNHTYVNGIMIQSNQETLLCSGTKLRFANEEFEFKLL